MSLSVRERALVACSFHELIAVASGLIGLWEKRWGTAQRKTWFRGVDEAGYPLDPGLLRDPYFGGELDEIEYSISLDFRLRARPYLSGPLSSWEQLFLMQHYGFPTRLLDWTESLSTAAYFSIRDINKEVDGAVWVLAPLWLVGRELSLTADHLSTHDGQLDLYKLREAKTDLGEFNRHGPLPILPEHLDKRIIAQQGRFTIHTFKAGALEELGDEDCEKMGEKCFLQQIIIPYCAKPAMRQQVRMFGGACEDTLFPDIEGLSRGMRWEAISMRKRPKEVVCRRHGTTVCR